MENFIKNTIIILITLFSVTINSYAQNLKKQYRLADKYIENYEYEKAIPIIKELLIKKPNNANFLFKIAFSYFGIREKRDSSIIYFEKIGNKVSEQYNNSFTDTVAPIEALVYLGDIYHADYKFEKAEKLYKRVKQKTENSSLISILDVKIRRCETAVKMINASTDITRIKIGGRINTKYNEHSPVLTADLKTIIFTSNRKGTGGLKDEKGDYYEDIYISKFLKGKWTKPKSISDNINTKGHEASVGLSPDGRTLLIYKSINNGDIFLSKKKADEWTIPKLLGNNINTKYRETHATISVSKNTIYFTSNRPGGYGGMDLYYSEKQKDGTWGEAVNMGKNINTPNNEEGPFIHPDDTTLFFSSNGHLGMGGYDLFMSFKQKNNTWSKPVNLGYPANSPSDDVFYIASPGGNYAFYVTNQIGSSGSNGIYMLGLPEKFRKKTAVFTGKVKLQNKKIKSVISINVIDIDTKDTIRTDYPNRKGNYSIILPTNKKFLVSYEAKGYLSHIIEIDVSANADLQSLKRVIYLQPIIIGGTNENYKLEFTPDTKKLDFKSKYKIDRAIKHVNNNKGLVVALNVPQKDSLNSKNVLSVKNYLINNRVDSNKITINYTDRDYYEMLVVDTIFLKFSGNIEYIKFVPKKKNIEIVSKHYLSQLIFFIQRNKELCIEIPVYKNEMLWESRISELYNHLITNGMDSLQVRMKIYNKPSKFINRIKPKLIKRTLDDAEFLFSITDKGYILSKEYQISVPVIIHYETLFSETERKKILIDLAKEKVDTTRIKLIPVSRRNNYINKTQLKIKINRGHSRKFFTASNKKKKSNECAIYLLPTQKYIDNTKKINKKVEINKKHSEIKQIEINRFSYTKKYNNKLQKNIARNY